MTATLRLPLEPPYTRGYADPWWFNHPVLGREVPIERFAPLVRTSGMGRWHRPRDGTRRILDGVPVRFVLTTWCGQVVHQARGVITADQPDDDPLCGTCEGRAIGAGYPPIGVVTTAELLFEPYSSHPPPPVCPAYTLGLVRDEFARAEECVACGELVPIRYRNRDPYGGNVRVFAGSHPPGPGLILPCPFHRWDQLVVRDGRAQCGCGTT